MHSCLQTAKITVLVQSVAEMMPEYGGKTCNKMDNSGLSMHSLCTACGAWALTTVAAYLASAITVNRKSLSTGKCLHTNGILLCEYTHGGLLHMRAFFAFEAVGPLGMVLPTRTPLCYAW